MDKTTTIIYKCKQNTLKLKVYQNILIKILVKIHEIPVVPWNQVYRV